MDPIQFWTLVLAGSSFALYIGIAIVTRAKSTGEFYIAGKGVPAFANGMATAADWMSAASFISMAGVISFAGRDGSMYLMGWTGGFVLLALLLAPYLRKFGKFTVPDFIGDRYYSSSARVIAVLCAIFISFTYVCGQMQGVGIVFTRFLGLTEQWHGVVIGMVIVFFYSVLGGMKGITYTQVAQYCVLIFAFLVPAIFISIQMTGHLFPQIGLGGEYRESGQFVLDRLDGLSAELGFGEYTARGRALIDHFCITAALMLGTAGLPHVIVRFYTVRRVSTARTSAGWALLFIAILYTTAPAVAVFARTNLLDTVRDAPYAEVPDWFTNWEKGGLIKFNDLNGDGLIQYTGTEGEGLPANELWVSKDIIVMANPEIAGLPPWVVGLVAAGALAAALSTAAGLLLVISTSVSHDLFKRTLRPDLTEKQELRIARTASGVAVVIAGIFGIVKLAFVAEVVAFAFGLAASSFFPAIIMGIFSKRMNREGAISGMVVGLVFTATYIIWFTFVDKDYKAGGTQAGEWPFFGISPQGIGFVGMLLNFAVALTVVRFTPPPPEDVRKIVENIRLPDTDP